VTIALFANDGLHPAIRFYDEGVYVVLAKALASRAGYVHESLPGSPPETKYPPVLPLLLAVVWGLFSDFPQNLIILRTVILISSGLFLYIAFMYLRNEFKFGGLEVTGALLMVALHPVYVNFSSLIASEVPFALFSLASLYCYSLFTSSGRLAYFVHALALAIIAAFTRTLGFVLLIALAVHLIGNRRFRLGIVASFFTVFGGLLWGVWSKRGRLAYVDYPSQIAINYLDYFGYLNQTDWIYQLHIMLPVNFSALIKYWTSFVFPWEGYVLGMPAVIVLATYFYGRGQLRQGAVHDIYFLLTIVVIMCWPWPISDRFLLTVSPFIISFAFIGIRHLMHLSLGHLMAAEKVTRLYEVCIFLVAVSATAYNLNYARYERENQRNLAPVYREFSDTLSWIQNNIPRSALLVGDSDSAYHLFTGLKAYRLSYPDPNILYYAPNLVPNTATVNNLRNWLRRVRACYLVYETINLGPWGTYQARLVEAFGGADMNTLLLIYTSTNRWFEVYQLKDCPSSDPK
jgi:hypothetical protein